MREPSESWFATIFSHYTDRIEQLKLRELEQYRAIISRLEIRQQTRLLYVQRTGRLQARQPGQRSGYRKTCIADDTNLKGSKNKSTEEW